MTGNGKPPADGGGDDNSANDGGNDTPDPSSYQKLKVANEDLQTKLDAQENQSAAERRKMEDRIKKLESVDTPKEDTERIALLEVKLARSTAVSRYGLSEKDADLLKGSPDEIIDDAKYWADRLKETDTKDKPKDGDKTNKQMIDDKVDNQTNDDPPPTKPAPKQKGNLSWLERFNASTPAEREKMDRDYDLGIDVPEGM